MKTLILLAALLMAQAHADTVWVCGKDGRSFTDSPCAEGQPRQVKDARDDSQRRAAREVAQRDQALADRMARERHAREAEHGSGLVGIKPSQPSDLKPRMDRERTKLARSSAAKRTWTTKRRAFQQTRG